ncbi:AbrB/MazE/SpoVT family DNA-binding domain-containing protein [Brevibacillus centrosporus]|uniref:AbrB/MazE/SpoVT family DNA-binding domain-containing protein n=1 Tax=Brevibacillus centrosporus TaxID=54910 RepID=UPI000F0A0C12|nr:AbrB/MazE/SpoVT family DNA-binding domain-containing protein [Brevibacillus centrosporus]MEC2133461.1 AbrB/MazE/SpoVT family DNA-binding domain-containing protein [Brevibacillus centrosporus]RNB62570.1 AbrB/MazE/SpoVT family DNA-binding domain-containing protein [Brevibacillus centrosporus]GED35062.1 AbrB family transcriptional regulator [Brevibacillus centrosporus]
MKATGIVRRVDDLGRVVIPMELRKTFGIKESDSMEIFVEGNAIVLRKYSPGCTLCGNLDKPLANLYPDKMVCTSCIDKIASLRHTTKNRGESL